MGLNPGRVKPMTYKFNLCHYLACHSALLGCDWMAQYQGNITEWIASRGTGGLIFQWGGHKSVPILIWP